MVRPTAMLLLLVGCAGRSHEPPPGVSTAPHDVPRRPTVLAAPEPDEEEPAVLAAPEPTVRPELVFRTGMSTSGKSVDPARVLERVRERPGMLQECAPFAAREPNALEGTWNVHLTLKGKGSELEMQSPVNESFALCIEDTVDTWDLSGLGSGSVMLLLGLEHVHEHAAAEHEPPEQQLD